MPRFLLALIVRRQIVIFVLEILSKRFGSNFFRFEQPDFYISDSRRGNFEFTIGIVFHKKFHQPLLFVQILDELNFSSYQNTFGLHAVAARHVRVLVEDPVVVGAKSYANAVIFFQQAHVPAMRIGVEDDFAIGISEIHRDNIRETALIYHADIAYGVFRNYLFYQMTFFNINRYHKAVYILLFLLIKRAAF